VVRKVKGNVKVSFAKLVAIQQPLIAPIEDTSPATMFGYFKEVVRQQLVGEADTNLPPPEQLDCSMTYVNIPWQSIIYDLLDYNKV
jgi:hypothetical protein